MTAIFTIITYFLARVDFSKSMVELNVKHDSKLDFNTDFFQSCLGFQQHRMFSTRCIARKSIRKTFSQTGFSHDFCFYEKRPNYDFFTGKF